MRHLLVPFCLGRNRHPLLSLQFRGSLLDIQRRKMVKKSPGAVFGLECRQNSVDQIRIGLSGLLCLRDILPQGREVVVEVADVARGGYVSMPRNERCGGMI